jgi:hypothetical protein
VGGAIFTLTLIITRTLTDYKESEKVPGDLAASLTSLFHDITVTTLKDGVLATYFQGHVFGFLGAITFNCSRTCGNPPGRGSS